MNLRETLKDIDAELEKSVMGPLFRYRQQIVTEIRKEAGTQNVPQHTPDEIISLDDMIREHIRNAVNATHGNKSDAAKMLGLKRTTLIEKMKHLGMKL